MAAECCKIMVSGDKQPVSGCLNYVIFPFICFNFADLILEGSEIESTAVIQLTWNLLSYRAIFKN